jgi:butyryl-CoA dehydrogenase/acyl-CoA dehydrogenase
VHLVLARIAEPDGSSEPGVKGISLFIVPKFLLDSDGQPAERNDVTLAGLNHKMGYRGTTNCLLNFGEGTVHRPAGKAGAIGYRVGEINRGMAYMFHMMNEARIGVGLGAAALGYTGYLHALDYARNRPQGRLVKDPTSAQRPIVEHADVRRMLLAQKAYAEGGLALNLYCARLIDEMTVATDADVKERKHLLLEILTPIAKSWPSQWCLAANDLAIQVHGGYGYTREFKPEQFYRDNRLNMIHEGTHGIQGLDLLGRKVVMQGGAAYTLLYETISTTIKTAHDGVDKTITDYAQQLQAALDRLSQVTQTLWGCGDPTVTLANASLYLEAFGHIVLAWIWLDKALAVGSSEGDFYQGKRAAVQYFFNYELPRVYPQLSLLESLDRTTLDVQDAWL